MVDTSPRLVKRQPTSDMTDAMEISGRRLAENLLDGPAYEWPAEEIYRFLNADGFSWNGQKWSETNA
jgi:hypothetical protein